MHICVQSSICVQKGPNFEMFYHHMTFCFQHGVSEYTANSEEKH